MRILFFALAVAVVFLALQGTQKAVSDARPWMDPVITPEEKAAMEWIRSNTADRAVFVTDIFGGEFVMGSTLREGTLGGDWAIVPNVVGRMSDVQYRFYESNSSKEAWETAVKLNATYATVPNRNIFAGYAWKLPNKDIFNDGRYFELVFDNGYRIYKVLK